MSIPWNKGKRLPQFSRENASSWKGGECKTSQGYIIVYKPEHPRAIDKYVKRSYLVIEKYIGRYLKLKEIVHHINNIKDDDRIENLKLFPDTSQHTIFHLTLKNKWAKNYNKCKNCRTTKIPHNAKGLCRSCYHQIIRKKDKGEKDALADKR